MKKSNQPLKILIFYQYFGTPNGGWSTRFYEFSRRWVEDGNQITIVTSPYYKSDLKASGFISKQSIEGIDLIVVNCPDSNKAGTLHRIFNAIKFSSVACFYALFLNYDLALSSSGPITIAVPGLLAKLIRRKNFVFEVRDLWPRGAIELQKIKNSALIKLGLSFERFIYNKADLVVSCSIGMDQGVKEVNDKVETLIIPNSSDNELFFMSGPQYPNGFPLEWRGNSVFIYAGSLGLMDECIQIIKGASKLNCPSIKCAIIGDGSEKELLQREVTLLGLEDVVLFIDLMPKQELVKWFSVATASFVTFKDLPVLHTNSPNKMFDSFAAGVPIIQSTKGWIKELIQEVGCGINVDPSNPQSFADAMITLHKDKDLTIKMGLLARKVANERFDRGKLAKLYLEKMKQI